MNNTLLNPLCRAVALSCAISMMMVVHAFAQSVDDNFKRELKLVEGLKVYNNQLVEQIKAQDKAKRDIATSIEDAKSLEPRVVPLMTKMLSALDKFIEADLPFHKDVRVDSINQMKALMVDATASSSDRFRNIMDLYTIEMEYGNTYEAYADTQTVNGEEIEVDMLRIGRLMLYYQTKDSKISAMWDRNTKTWIALPEEMNRHIRKAIKVAAKQIAPELMNLLILAPEEV